METCEIAAPTVSAKGRWKQSTARPRAVAMGCASSTAGVAVSTDTVAVGEVPPPATVPALQAPASVETKFTPTILNHDRRCEDEYTLGRQLGKYEPPVHGTWMHVCGGAWSIDWVLMAWPRCRHYVAALVVHAQHRRVTDLRAGALELS